MSPSAPPAPERAGSTRHAACLLPLASVGLAEFARLDHRARPPHQRIAGVVMRQREDAARRRDRRLDRHGFFQRQRQRLVADDMHARFQERQSRPGVDMIRRDDGDRLDSVSPRRLRGSHALVVVVNALQPQRRAGPARLLGRRRQRPGDERVMIVHARGEPMHRADEGALAAADHAEPHAPARNRIR